MLSYNFSSEAVFVFLVCGLTILALGYLTIKLIKLLKVKHEEHVKDRNDSLKIIKMRFAKGQLSSDEYVRMRSILLRPLPFTF